MNSQIPETRQKRIVRKVIQDSTPEERARLLLWSEGLLEIRRSNLGVYRKASESLAFTRKSKVIWPVVKRITTELKKVGWDKQSWKVRLGLGAIILAVAAFGKAKAGIAALGSAIGVPLWVVFGAGGTFAGMLIDEAMSMLQKPPETTYTVIEGKLTESSRTYEN